jgi:hypothetical protein
MSTLKEIFDGHDGHLIHKWDHYFDVYERYFSRYRNTPVNILEIGISHGGSLQMWKEYFGEQANIFAVDINPECKKFEGEKIKIFIGSQEDENFLDSLVSHHLPPLDILIDDGGHTMRQQVMTFNKLFSSVKDGGIYLVEDTHTSYWQYFNGGYKKKSSFIEFSKDIVDQMYAWHINNEKLVPVNYFTRHINSICFYDSIVVFEKGLRREPSHSMKGHESIAPFGDAIIKEDSFIAKVRKKLFPDSGSSFSKHFRKKG